MMRFMMLPGDAGPWLHNAAGRGFARRFQGVRWPSSMRMPGHVLTAALLIPWIASLSCASASLMDGYPRKQYQPITEEVAPGKARVYLTRVETHNGQQVFHLLLADALVGRPLGQGMPFTVTESAGKTARITISEPAGLQVVPVGATPIAVLPRDGAVPPEQMLPPTLDVPRTVVIQTTYLDQSAEIHFWYRDRLGLVQQGEAEIRPNLTGFTPWTEHLKPVGLVVTVPVDIVLCAGAIVLAPFVIISSH
jgi:hypothetical protein